MSLKHIDRRPLHSSLAVFMNWPYHHVSHCVCAKCRNIIPNGVDEIQTIVRLKVVHGFLD
jgi:hypothetical protein